MGSFKVVVMIRPIYFNDNVGYKNMIQHIKNFTRIQYSIVLTYDLFFQFSVSIADLTRNKVICDGAN